MLECEGGGMLAPVKDRDEQQVGKQVSPWPQGTIVVAKDGADATLIGDSFTLFILDWVPHAAVLAIIISMVAMAFMQAPTSNPREEGDAWLRRPIQWGETQNMWMPFYSFFAMSQD